MSSDTKAELIQGQELNREYPGLAGAFRRAQTALKTAIQPFRKDFDFTVPPLFLCDDQTLNRDVTIVSRDSTREGNDQRGYAHYQPYDNIIYAAREGLKTLIAQGDEGFRLTTLILAEEVLHALTTTSINGLKSGLDTITISCNCKLLAFRYVTQLNF